MNRTTLILVLIIGIISAACSRETPTPTVEKSYNVVFSVTGTAPRAVIGFRCDHKSSDHGVVSEVYDVPWEKRLTCRPSAGQNFSLSATHRVDSPGSLTCEIFVDGTLQNSETLSQMKDGLSIISCSVFP